MAEAAQGAARLYSNPYGDFSLSRYPLRRNEPLLAWCGADTLLLEEAHRLGIAGKDILVVNDAHGALALSAAAANLWTDSWLAAEALRRNAAHNKLATPQIHWSTASPPPAPLVLMRAPKQLAYLDFQLQELARAMPERGRLLVAGMDKHLSPHTAERMETLFGPTERHRGRKKARLFSAERQQTVLPEVEAPEASWFCEQLGATVVALPNVFSRSGLDGGSRLLLQHLPQLDAVDAAIDLACGNGVIGMAALRCGIAGCVTFCDESAQAIDSTKRNIQRLYPKLVASLRFHHGDGLLGLDEKDADLILCNPPFHMDHAVDPFAGSRLIEQCGHYLKPGGMLLLVANRHLNYRAALKADFKATVQIAENARFRLLLARK